VTKGECAPVIDAATCVTRVPDCVEMASATIRDILFSINSIWVFIAFVTVSLIEEKTFSIF
jgi:hypothetical protein